MSAIQTNVWSKTSRGRLVHLNPRLRDLMDDVLQVCDCTIISTYRDETEQNELHRTGKSQLRYPESKHNAYPALAVDVAAYPIDWKDRERATLFAGLVLGMAAARGLALRWGGDWDRDWQVNDNGFDDLWHFEIVEDS